MCEMSYVPTARITAVFNTCLLRLTHGSMCVWCASSLRPHTCLEQKTLLSTQHMGKLGRRTEPRWSPIPGVQQLASSTSPLVGLHLPVWREWNYASFSHPAPPPPRSQCSQSLREPVLPRSLLWGQWGSSIPLPALPMPQHPHSTGSPACALPPLSKEGFVALIMQVFLQQPPLLLSPL